MITVELRDHTGTPWAMLPGLPVCITVSSHPDPSRLPPGPPVTLVPRADGSSARRRARRGKLRTHAELERIAAHVVGWSGVYYGAVSLPCSKSVLVGILARAPWVANQLTQAIHDASASGVR